MANFYANYPASSASSNPSTGVNGSPAPAYSTEVGGVGPDGNLHPVKVANDGTLATNTADTTASGTITGVGQTIVLSNYSGASAWSLQLSGTFNAGTTVTWEVSDDGVNYTTVNGRKTGTANGQAILATTASGGTGLQTYRGNLAATANFRVRCTAYAAGDSVTVNVRASIGEGAIFLNSALPPGVNNIGTVQLIDAAGVNQNTIKPASTAPVATDTALVVALSPNSTAFVQPVAAVNNGGTVNAAGVIFQQDCSQLMSVSMQVTALPAGNVLQFQVSNDNATWVNASMMPAGDLIGILASTAVAAGTYLTQLNSRYFRVNCTTFTTGPVTVVAYFKAFGNSPNSIGGYVSAVTLDGAGNAIGSTSGALNTAITTSVLPTGAATSALQTALNAQIPATLGAKATAASLAVNIASDQTVSVSASALPLPSGAATSALQTALNAQIPTTLGAKVTAASLAVNIASDQTVPISASSLPLPSGAATSALQTSGNTSLSTIATNSGTQATSANQTSGNSSLSTIATNTGSPVSPKGRAIANAPVYNAYSTTNVLTSAFVQLIASTTLVANYVDIFDSSGNAMIIAVGAAGSEVIQAYIPPGGDQIPLTIAAGSRVSIKALTASSTSGFLLVNLYV